MAKGKTIQRKPSINPSEYIQIPNSSILIAEQEGYNGLTWENTHFKLAENGLFMPTPSLFMGYFKSVRDAAQGKQELYYGSGKQLTKEEIKDIYLHLTSNCRTWLNALFEKGKIKTVKSVDLANRKLNFVEKDLEACIMEDCFVALEFNSQGLPVKKSEKQEYKRGENIYFWYPRDGTVAWFSAVPGGAVLFCDGDLRFSGALLGVFACAEGTGQKNSQVETYTAEQISEVLKAEGISGKLEERILEKLKDNR